MTNYCPIPGASQPKEPVRLIDASNVMEAVFGAVELYDSEYLAIQHEIEKIPTIDPESLRPTAKWENEDDFYGDSIVWYCSACKERFILHDGTPEENNYKYCPSCGARMVNTNDKHCT